MTTSDNYTDYDFIDFGASKGGSINFAKIFLGGKNGLGLDIDQKKIDMMISSGYECEFGDITNLSNVPDNSVRFVMISHVLEHLHSLEDIKKSINEAIRVATDFVYIQGPNFDDDDYLEENHLRFFWSYWKGHTYHFKSSELITILNDCSGYQDAVVAYRGPLSDSGASCIHSLDSPIDQQAFSEKLHPSKPVIRFNKTIYKEIVAAIVIDKSTDAKALVSCRGKVVDVETGQSYGKVKLTELLNIALKVIISGQLIHYIKKLIK